MAGKIAGGFILLLALADCMALYVAVSVSAHLLTPIAVHLGVADGNALYFSLCFAVLLLCAVILFFYRAIPLLLGKIFFFVFAFLKSSLTFMRGFTVVYNTALVLLSVAVSSWVVSLMGEHLTDMFIPVSQLTATVLMSVLLSSVAFWSPIPLGELFWLNERVTSYE